MQDKLPNPTRPTWLPLLGYGVDVDGSRIETAEAMIAKLAQALAASEAENAAWKPIIDALMKADESDALSTIKVEVLQGGYPRQWLWNYLMDLAHKGEE